MRLYVTTTTENNNVTYSNCSDLTGFPQIECEAELIIPIPFWADCAILAAIVIIIVVIIVVVCCKKKKPKMGYDPLDDDEPDGDERGDKNDKGKKKGEDSDAEQEAGGDQEQVGSLQISLNYENKRQMLHLNIVKASELRVNQTGTCNPHCRCFLEEDRKHYGETSVKEHTTNPEFDYKWECKIPVKEVMSKTLIIAVYDADKLAKNKNIGYLRIPLAEKNGEIIRKGIKDEWRNLQPITSAIEATKPGEVCLSLQYIAGESKLIVVVFEAKALKRSEQKEQLNPYVELQLKQRLKKEPKKKKGGDSNSVKSGHESGGASISSANDDKVKRKVLKTYSSTVKRKTNDPYFNEEFPFLAKLETMREAELYLTVMHDTGMGPVKIGRLLFSKRSPGSAGEHWKEAIQAAAGRPVAMWHTLQQPQKK